MSQIGPEGVPENNGSSYQQLVEEALNSHLAKIESTYSEGPIPSVEAKIDAMIYAMLQLAAAKLDSVSVRMDIEDDPQEIVDKWLEIISEAEKENWEPMIEEVRFEGSMLYLDLDEQLPNPLENLALSLK
jgi:hypothetical protein